MTVRQNTKKLPSRRKGAFLVSMGLRPLPERFRCELELRRGEARLERVEKIGVVRRGESNALALSPVIILRVDGEGGTCRKAQRLLLLLAVVGEGEGKARWAVLQPSFAERNEIDCVRQGLYPYPRVKPVRSAPNLFLHRPALPFVPVGNVGKTGGSVYPLELPELRHPPSCAARAAEQLCALCVHLEFLPAGRAAVKRMFKPFRTPGSADNHSCPVLPVVFVIGERLLHHILNLSFRHRLRVLCRQQQQPPDCPQEPRCQYRSESCTGPGLQNI